MPYCYLLHGELNYSQPVTAYSERGSLVSIIDNGHVGFGGCQLSYLRGNRLLAPRWLQFKLVDPDTGEELPWFWKVQHLPYGILREGLGDETLVGRAMVSFVDSDTAWFGMEIANRGEAPVRFQVIGESDWASEGCFLNSSRWRQDLNVWELTSAVERTHERDPKLVFNLFQHVRLDPEPAHLYAMMAGEQQDLMEHQRIQQRNDPANFQVEWPAVTLEQDQTWSVRVQWGFSYDDPAPSAIRVTAGWVNIMDVSEVLRQGREYWEHIFDRLNKPDDLDEGRMALCLHAFGNLMRNLVSPAGRFDTHHACYPAKGHYSAQWMLDSCFHALGLGEFSQNMSVDSLEILIKNQLPDGRIPQYITQGWVHPEEDTQPPIVCWALWRLYQRFRNKEFLERAYMPLTRYARWWEIFRDEDRDGLCEPRHDAEKDMVGSPRWNGCQDGGHRRIAVDLNAFLVMQKRGLAKIGHELEYGMEADEWDVQADELGQLIVERLYCAEDNLFYDVEPDSGEFVKVITPASFLPLWAGVPIAEDDARRMIEDVLLNEATCFGRVPFPTVAYNDPRYEPEAAWRGATSFTYGFWMIEILHRYGYADAAREAEKRLLDTAMANQLFF